MAATTTFCRWRQALLLTQNSGSSPGKRRQDEQEPNNMAAQPEARYTGPTLSVTVSPEGRRVHQLIDDTSYARRPHKIVVRRDPMVEALFGAAVARATEPIQSP